jgi:hypothetical protein
MTTTNDSFDVAALRCERDGDGFTARKTIILGNYPSALALRDALTERNVQIGDLAAEMLRLPTFELFSPYGSMDLSVVAVSQLVPGSNRVTFANIHAHALEAGLYLCPPEVAPQLRLQYPDQKIGEYLLVGMKPLPIASGSVACFVVGNGGAGLLIIGRFAEPRLTISSRSKIVFALRQ